VFPPLDTFLECFVDVGSDLRIKTKSSNLSCFRENNFKEEELNTTSHAAVKFGVIKNPRKENNSFYTLAQP
jgi:hypothetical protein